MASSTYTDIHEIAFDGLPSLGGVIMGYGPEAGIGYGMVLDRLDTVVRHLAKLLDCVVDGGFMVVIAEEGDEGEEHN